MFSETSIFDPILVPTWLHFGIPNPLKSNQKSIPRGIRKMIDFCIDFLTILAAFGEPSWGHVGHLFGENGGGKLREPTFLLRWRFFSASCAAWIPSCPHVGSILGPLDPILARFWKFVGSMLAPFWCCAGPFGRKSWHLFILYGYSARVSNPTSPLG